MPEPLLIDLDCFAMSCVDDCDQTYVDVRIDTIPFLEDDPDYSENPGALRKAAAWLVKAAEWLEREQRA